MEKELIFRELKAEDVPLLLPLYIDYYNTVEGACWTDETAGKRIRQVIGIPGSFGLTAELSGETAGFLMGYFQQYDDLIAYDLEEIVIRRELQGMGLGSRLLAAVAQRAKEKGAAMIQLSSVNDEMHAHFYGKFGFKNAGNLIPKSKFF